MVPLPPNTDFPPTPGHTGYEKMTFKNGASLPI